MSVVVTLTLEARPDRYDALAEHLAAVLPDTAAAPGAELIRASADPERLVFTVFQIWDRIESREAYIAWRTAHGEIAALDAFVRSPPEFRVQQLLF